MMKLTYPVKIIPVGSQLLYQVVDFPDITMSDSSPSTVKDIVFSILYDRIEERIYDMAFNGKDIPKPTVISADAWDSHVYITVPFERKEFYWRKPFMDRCIGSAVISTFFTLSTQQDPIYTLFTWLFVCLCMFIVLSIVSLLTIRLQIDLSFERVSLGKRLTTILGLSLLAAVPVFVF